MGTSTLLGIAHFLMQTDPNTAQYILSQLTAQETAQVVQIIQAEEKNEMKLPLVFSEKVMTGTTEMSSPSHETGIGKGLQINTNPSAGM